MGKQSSQQQDLDGRMEQDSNGVSPFQAWKSHGNVWHFSLALLFLSFLFFFYILLFARKITIVEGLTRDICNHCEK